MSSTEVGTRGAATVIADTKTIAEATPDKGHAYGYNHRAPGW